MQLLSVAKETVDIASFYWTMRGRGSVKDPTDKEVGCLCGSVAVFRDWYLVPCLSEIFSKQSLRTLLLNFSTH